MNLSYKCLKYFVLISLLASASTIYAHDLKVKKRHVLSSTGSTHSARYLQTNKIVSANGKTHVAWIEYDKDIKVKSYDHNNDTWETTVKLGRATDNHGGPALAIDDVGYLHAFYGPHDVALPHAGVFDYRTSFVPWYSGIWNGDTHFGDNATYPSVVIDRNKTIHIAYRGENNPSKLIYQYKKANANWSTPKKLVMPVGGTGDAYTNYGHSLMLSEDGDLHLLYILYLEHTTSPHVGRRSRWAGHMKTSLLNNGVWSYGNAWKSAAGNYISTPVTPGSLASAFVKFVSTQSHLSLHASNLALDSNGNPWFIMREETFETINYVHQPVTLREYFLYHHNGSTWVSTNLEDILPLELHNSYIPNLPSVSIDANDNMYITGLINHSIKLLYKNLRSATNTYNVLEVEPQSPNRQYHFIANIERTSNQNKIGIPWMLYSYTNNGDTPYAHVVATQLSY